MDVFEIARQLTFCNQTKNYQSIVAYKDYSTFVLQRDECRIVFEGKTYNIPTPKLYIFVKTLLKDIQNYLSYFLKVVDNICYISKSGEKVVVKICKDENNKLCLGVKVKIGSSWISHIYYENELSRDYLKLIDEECPKTKLESITKTLDDVIRLVNQ